MPVRHHFRLLVLGQARLALRHPLVFGLQPHLEEHLFVATAVLGKLLPPLQLFACKPQHARLGVDSLLGTPSLRVEFALEHLPHDIVLGKVHGVRDHHSTLDILQCLLNFRAANHRLARGKLRVDCSKALIGRALEYFGDILARGLAHAVPQRVKVWV